MKLNLLSPDELDAYENWDSADHNGGGCQGIGYAWCAFDFQYAGPYAGDIGIVILENSDGFVTATTYGDAQRDEYANRVEELRQSDTDFARDEELDDLRSGLEDALEQANRACMGKCDQCENVMVNGANAHEHGCPNVAKAQRITHALDTLED